MKFKIFILIGIFCISLVSACQESNNFSEGGDIIICTGDCIYENSSELGSYVDCDDTVYGFLTVSYENGSIIFQNEPMTRNGSHYEFNATDYISNQSETYNGQFNFLAEKGWDDPVDFLFSIESTSVTTSAGSGAGAFSLPATVQAIGVDVDGIKEELKEHTKRYLLIAGLFIIIGLFILKDLKKYRIQRLAKEVNKINFKKK